MSLQPTQLQVQLQDTNASVVSLVREHLSPRVVLMLDTSGSMAGLFASQKWTDALVAAGFVLDAIPPDSPVALVTFAEERQTLGFGSAQQIHQKLLELKDLKPIKRTALYNSVEASINMLAPPKFGDTIFIVSDAGDNFGSEKRKEVAEELMQRGIRAFAFIVREPWGSPTPPEGRDRPIELIEFVRSTGGNYVNPQISSNWISTDEAIDLVRQLRAQLQSPYRLELQLTSAAAKPSRLKVNAQVKGLELSYPHRVEPCMAADNDAKP